MRLRRNPDRLSAEQLQARIHELMAKRDKLRAEQKRLHDALERKLTGRQE